MNWSIRKNTDKSGAKNKLPFCLARDIDMYCNPNDRFITKQDCQTCDKVVDPTSKKNKLSPGERTSKIIEIKPGIAKALS